MAKFPKTPAPLEPEPPIQEATLADLLARTAELLTLARTLLRQIRRAYPTVTPKDPEDRPPEVKAANLFAPLGVTSFHEAEWILNDRDNPKRWALHTYISILEYLEFPVWKWLTMNTAQSGAIWSRTELGHAADGEPVQTTAKRRFDQTKKGKEKTEPATKEQDDHERDD